MRHSKKSLSPRTRWNARRVVCVLGSVALLAAPALGAEDDAARVAKVRATMLKTHLEKIVPFFKTYCIECHGEKKQEKGVRFDAAVRAQFAMPSVAIWKRAVVPVKQHDMPPGDQTTQPSDGERQTVLAWISGLKYLNAKDPGVFVIRRLTKVEYGNTLHDLFGVDPQVARDLPDEVVGAGYTNSFSPSMLELYLQIANEALDKSFSQAGAAPTEAERRLLGDPPAPGADVKEAARKAARLLARQVFRRPATEPELETLVKVFALASDKGKSYSESTRLMVKAALVSPQFLYITPHYPGEASDAEPASQIVALDDFQLASRLSYLLWATMPDAELSAAADAGKLRDPEAMAAQARRMLADPRSRALFDGFGAQWLGLDKLAGKTFDADKFPQMTTELRLAMYEEARLLFEHILRENLSLRTFIECDYAFLNEELAPIYGLEGKVTGAQFRKVSLSDANRGGILTTPGVLAMSSFPNRTSPVNRGLWVLEQVLGQSVPPPPPNTPPLDAQDKKKIEAMTIRQRTEMHRANPACASCHNALDPIGFGLENFDAIGRWRVMDDAGGAIDASGELPGGKEFSTPAELKRIVAERSDDFSRNLISKLLSFALGRRLGGYDEVVVEQLGDQAAKEGYRMQSLVVSVVTSYPFMNRRLNNPGDVSRAK